MSILLIMLILYQGQLQNLRFRFMREVLMARHLLLFGLRLEKTAIQGQAFQPHA